jgi:hypothetical protein
MSLSIFICVYNMGSGTTYNSIPFDGFTTSVNNDIVGE